MLNSATQCLHQQQTQLKRFTRESNKPVPKHAQNKHFHTRIWAWVCLHYGYVAFASYSHNSDNVSVQLETHTWVNHKL